MGSSSSKPRKGHEPHHLPKVGSPANQHWEHETHESVVFGSPARAFALGAILVLIVIGLLVLTL